MISDYKIDNLIMAEQILKKCKASDRDRYVVLARYFQGKSLRELGEELGVSGTRIRQIERKTLRSLRSTGKRDYQDSLR
jgi:RNA polymerase sigma factor (sigma-70 family)